MAFFNEYIQFSEGKYYPNLEKINLDKAKRSYKEARKEAVKWKKSGLID
jgi:hypothetical protein